MQSVNSSMNVIGVAMDDDWYLETDSPHAPGNRRSLIGYLERYEAVEELFDGDVGAIRRWLLQPNKGLGNVAPLDAELADVKDLVGRLIYGSVT